MGRLLPGTAVVVTAMSAFSLIGCEDDVDIPEGPNLAPLAAQYNFPDGTLNQQNIKDVAEQALVEFNAIEKVGALDFVVDTFDAVDDTIQKFADPDGNPDDDIGGRVKVNGVAYVQTICPGRTERLDRAVNGILEMNVPFQESLLAPVLFGGFRSCQFMVTSRAGGTRDSTFVELDSDINAYVGPGVRLSLKGLQSVLFQLPDGTVSFDGGPPESFDTDFRRFVDGRLEVRVEVEDGDVVPFINRDTRSVGIRASNASYCCDFEERICIETSEPQCTMPADGDRTLTW